jgi:hypothetical protein
MSTLLNNTSYEVTPDHLIIDSNHPVDVKVVKIPANQGTVKRGTVISLTNTNEYLVFGTGLVAPQTSAKANGIVAEDVDTTSTDATVSVIIYISGHFNKNVLTVKAGSLAVTDLEDLRNAGIFVSSSIN